MKKILVLNCGGATLKYKLFAMPAERVLAQGHIDRLGTERAVFTHTVSERGSLQRQQPIPDHLSGMRLVFAALVDPEHGVLSSLEEIDALAHKLAHGGEKIRGAVRITEEVIAAMEEMVPLVPLHNPPNLQGIAVVRELLPAVPQFGTFETSFHHTVPQHAWLYPLPYEWYEKYHVRSYGFHSASHRYVTQRAAELVGRRPEELKIISCHLGSGTSVCAIKYGQSLDISSGLTPQSGTTMSTRPGDFDPFVITYLMERAGIDAAEMNRILTRESGLLGISGLSGDMRDLEEAAAAGNERAALALRVFNYYVRRFIGAYLVELGGVDVLSFTGGIGENSPRIRAEICAGMEWLGIAVDPQRNNCWGEERIISPTGQSVKVVVVCTDEELIVARDAFRLLSND
ncbi:MAG TPA: acetate kinase [Armatimonadetes bacterium]|nr:acetate kinase [Armatimonadota bacterium]